MKPREPNKSTELPAFPAGDLTFETKPVAIPELTDSQFELLDSGTPIQPILIGDPGRTVALSAALEERGLLVTAIRPPTVPVGTSRLRVTLTAAHETADVDRLLECLEEIAAEHVTGADGAQPEAGVARE